VMRVEELQRVVWALVAAATSGDEDGLHVLVDDLDAEDARAVVYALATVTARAVGWRADRGRVLALLREQLLADAKDGEKP
jgi:hypothetical protein